MPDNCCVPLCCKSGYRVGPDGGKITYHSLPTTDPRRLKVFIFVAIAPEQSIIIVCTNAKQIQDSKVQRFKDLEVPTLPISGSDEIRFPLGLYHCQGREVQTKS